MSQAPGGGDALRVARLLEEGSGDELRQLVADLGEGDPGEGDAEAVLASWLAQRGGRELTRRSRAFWELVLAVPAGPSHPLAEELWPLA